MKYIKMLGLAAVAAAALMAFLGASTASATVLCKTTPTTTGTTASCPSGWDYAAGTTITASIKSGNTVHLVASPIDDTCSESTVSGSTANTGGASETVSGNISTLDWSTTNCTCTTDTITNGSLEIHRISGTYNGTLTGKNSEVTVNCGGISCIYGTAATGTHLGTLTASPNNTSHAELDIKEVTLPKKGGSFLCPPTGEWNGNYTVTSPVPLYVADTG